MKKIFVLITISFLSASVAFAQDFAKATELAKQANEALVSGDATVAIENFKAAVAEATNCQETEALELINTCKQGITRASYKFSNDLLEQGKLDEAIAKLQETIAAAKEYADDEILEKATEKKYQVFQVMANGAIKSKDFAKAAQCLDSVLISNPANGKALLQKGQVLAALGKVEQAIESYLAAKENGMEAAANKQISNIYLKQASAKLKAKDFAGAIAAAGKSNEYNESANAYKIAGVASNSAKNLQDAYDNLSKYLELAPNAADAAQIKAAVDAIKAQLKK